MTTERRGAPCPLETPESSTALIDYAASSSADDKYPELARHIAGCDTCSAWLSEQSTLWEALDTWEPAPISDGFNRRLWQRIDALADAPWHRKLVEHLRYASWKPAVSLAAAVMVIAAGFIFDHQTPHVSAPSFGTTAVEADPVEADQVEQALDDLQLLHALK